MINFTTITKLDNGKWEFDWTPTAAEFYRVILFGEEVERIIEPPLEYGRVEDDLEPPPIEVVEEDELALSEENKPFIVLQWWPDRAANHYEVQRYNGVSWVRHLFVNENGSAVYSVRTPVEDDNDVINYRVLAHDEIEQVSPELVFTVLFVCPPVISIEETTLSYAPNTITVS